MPPNAEILSASNVTSTGVEMEGEDGWASYKLHSVLSLPSQGSGSKFVNCTVSSLDQVTPMVHPPSLALIPGTYRLDAWPMVNLRQRPADDSVGSGHRSLDDSVISGGKALRAKARTKTPSGGFWAAFY
jgi:hypothetical protein